MTSSRFAVIFSKLQYIVATTPRTNDFHFQWGQQCHFLSTGDNLWNRRTSSETVGLGQWSQKSKTRQRRGVAGNASAENNRLTEVITIYEKLTKSRDREEELRSGDDDNSGEDVFRPSSSYFDYLGKAEDDDSGGAGGGINSILQRIRSSPIAEPGKFAPSSNGDSQSPKVLDFSKFRNILGKNYAYFSAKTGLLQSHTLESLIWDGSSAGGQGINNAATTTSLGSHDLILNTKQFCLSIINPTAKDLAFLGSQLHVHDLTLRDIRKENTEEKVEVFKHYTFLSLRPYLDSKSENSTPTDFTQSTIDKNMQPLLTRSRDIDLNILLFPDFVIIVHQGHHWSGFKDMLGFLNLLSSYGNSPLTPDWILFSIFIELAQDAKYCVKSLEPKILNIKVADSIMENGGENLDKDALATELSNVLTKNFENEFEIYKINGFIKPKIKVLKLLRPKCGNRIGSGVLNLLSGTRKEFEELGEALNHFSHILERSQDTCLTMANVRQSQESNAMGKAMKRISEVALLFLPLQALAGFLGMNVRVPFQEVESTAPFWGIILSCSVLLVALYRVSKSASKVRVVKKATSLGFKK